MKMKLLIGFVLLTVVSLACRSGTPIVETVVETQELSVSTTVVETPTRVATQSVETPTAQPVYEPRFQEAACPFDLPPDQVEGQSVECGYLVVPEDRRNPTSGDIRLAAAIFRHPDGAKEPDPIIYLSGGPGGSALELLYLTFDQVFAPYFAAGRDLIFLDQRGVGLSKPALDCPAVQELSIDLLDNQVGGRELTDQQIYELVLDSLKACGEDLSEIAELSAYNTSSNASDIDDLRLALGYDQVNLWGISYGTRLALAVMRDYPDGLRSVVLDSTYPPDVDLYLEAPANTNRAFNVLFEACAADPVCSEYYPDLDTVFFSTVDQLEARPFPTVITHPFTGENFDAIIDGETLMALIFQLFYETELLPRLPMLIYQTNQGDFEMLSRIYGLFLVEIPLVSQGMSLSVQCNEEMAFSSFEEYQGELAKYPRFSPLFEYSTMGEMAFQLCEAWNSGQAETLENEPVTSRVPVLVMAGEYDPVTPPTWGLHAAGTLENSYYFEYPGTGHGASTVAGCPRQMMLAFLAHPTQAPENTCVSDMQITFIVPTDLDGLSFVPAEVPDLGIQTIAPEGWTQVQPEYYISPDQSIEMVFTHNQDASPDELLQRWGASEPLQQIQANDLNWTLYEVAMEDLGAAGYVAVSPAETGFYIVLVISTPEKQIELLEALFMPVVAAFVVDTP